MSKNFELLRQAGWKQDFFEGAQPEAATSRKLDPPASPPPTAQQPSPSRRRAKLHPPGEDQISSLVSRLFLDPRSTHVRSVTFCGIAPRSGCTWACAQTGRTLASLVDATVCVVDANFTASSLHGEFSIDNLVGLSDAILQGKPALTFVRQVEGSNLYVLAAGGECTRARNETTSIAKSLRALRSEFDYLLVDAPLVANGAAVAGIAQAGDGAILVLGSKGIALDPLLKAKERLKSARVPLIGVVLNDRSSSSQPPFGELFK